MTVFEQLMADAKALGIDEEPKGCYHQHQLVGTGGVRFTTAKLVRCAECGGYQRMKWSDEK